MSSLRLARALAGAGLLLALPAVIAAQDAPADHTHAPGEPEHAHEAADLTQINAWLVELEQVHRQLEGLQREALADPELSALQLSIGDEMHVAMTALDPSLELQMARMMEIRMEHGAAQGAGNTDAVGALEAEAQQIQNRYMQVQQQALEQPALAARVGEFQTRVEAKMVEIDPAAQSLVDRMRELETLLRETIGG